MVRETSCRSRGRERDRARLAEERAPGSGRPGEQVLGADAGPPRTAARRRSGSSRGPSHACGRSSAAPSARASSSASRRAAWSSAGVGSTNSSSASGTRSASVGAGGDGQLVEDRDDAVVVDVRARLARSRAPERAARRARRGRGGAAGAGTRARTPDCAPSSRRRDVGAPASARSAAGEVHRVGHVEQPVDVDRCRPRCEALRVRGHARPSLATVGAQRERRRPVQREPRASGARRGRRLGRRAHRPGGLTRRRRAAAPRRARCGNCDEVLAREAGVAEARALARRPRRRARRARGSRASPP